jgi:hypothetical protein
MWSCTSEGCNNGTPHFTFHSFGIAKKRFG